MDLEGVKKQLERGGNENENSSAIDSLPSKFFDHFIMAGIKVHSIQPGRILCSFKVPPRLLNSGGFMHGGATASLVDLLSAAVIYSCGATTTGVSVEINVSYLDAAFPNVRLSLSLSLSRV
ncbi:Thioesterase domain [Dillenia turbinata]|uniref:Thioesterase domain n=1 Tax=Dillenia turbinata TaxID=194707 RepID=A0AAN8UZ96_9MAGN